MSNNPLGLSPNEARNGISPERARAHVAFEVLADVLGGGAGRAQKALDLVRAAEGGGGSRVAKAKKGGAMIAVYAGGALVGIVDPGDLTSSSTAPGKGQVQFENAQGQPIGFADPAKARPLQQGTPISAGRQAVAQPVRHPSLEPAPHGPPNPAAVQPGAVAKALLAQAQLAQRQRALWRGLEREVDQLVRKQRAGIAPLFLTLGQDSVIRKRLAKGGLTPNEQKALLLLQLETKPAPLPRVKRRA